MIKKIKQLFSQHFNKKGKVVAAMGIIGILLIGFSSFIPQSQPKSNTVTKSAEQECEEYRKRLEDQIKEIVVGITGDDSASVVVTLETGMRYSYASETEENTNDSVADTKSDTQLKIKKNYITVKNEDGGEEPLIITQYMPSVRGVAVVSRSANNEKICQSITDAVTATLGITSKKVYVSAPVS